MVFEPGENIMKTRAADPRSPSLSGEKPWRWLITHETYADFSTSTSPALEKAVMGGQSPETVALNLFPCDSITVGVLDDPEKACDLEFCREQGIVVRRRNTTGGAIYAAAGSSIVCYYLRTTSPGIPKTMEESFRLLLEGFAVALRRVFSINAVYRPVNDVEVNGRKLTASSCKIEEDFLIFRNVLNVVDIDREKAARSVPIPPEKTQDKAFKRFQERFTCLEREAGRPIRQEEIETLTRIAVDSTFGSWALVPGRLSALENISRTEYQRMYTADSWFYANSESARFGPEHRGAQRAEARHKAPAGLVRAVVLRRGGTILDLIITGDFHPRPHTLLRQMEDALRGAPLDPAVIRQRIGQIYSRPGVEVAGVSLEDFALPILSASLG
jgi:lipoate-protein ligase A